MATTTNAPALVKTDISACKSASEVMECLGLDKPYTTKPIPDFPGSKGIYSPSGKPVCVVNSTYDLLQPREAFELMHPTVSKFGGQYTEATFLKGGTQLVISAKLRESSIKREDRRKGDVIQQNINFYTSFDGSKQSNWALQLYRVWCDNGCASWESLLSMSLKHTINQRKRLPAISERLNNIETVGGSLFNQMNQLAATPFNKDQAEIAAKRVVKGDKTRSINIREAILNEFHNEKRGTFGSSAWDMFNAFTAYQTHEQTYRETAGVSRDENRLSALVFGQENSAAYLSAIQFALSA